MRTLLFFSILLVTLLSGNSATLTLGWDANPPSQNVQGYKIYWGTASRNYPNRLDVGNVTTASLSTLNPGVRYFIAVTNYEIVCPGSGACSPVESIYSDEISYLVPVPTPVPTASPSPTPSPTPIPTFVLGGHLTHCDGSPVVGFDVDLSDGNSSTTANDGTYEFSGLTSGSYTITPRATSLIPGADGINTVDVIVISNQYLGLANLSPCERRAADATNDGRISTIDVLAVQRFSIGITTGLTGHSFSTPSSLTINLTDDQTNQDFTITVIGDVSPPYAR